MSDEPEDSKATAAVTGDLDHVTPLPRPRAGWCGCRWPAKSPRADGYVCANCKRRTSRQNLNNDAAEGGREAP